jgi:hypothetical protein
VMLPYGINHNLKTRITSPNRHMSSYDTTLLQLLTRIHMKDISSRRRTYKYVGSSDIASRNQCSLVISRGDWTVMPLIVQISDCYLRSMSRAGLRSVCFDYLVSQGNLSGGGTVVLGDLQSKITPKAVTLLPLPCQ